MKWRQACNTNAGSGDSKEGKPRANRRRGRDWKVDNQTKIGDNCKQSERLDRTMAFLCRDGGCGARRGDSDEATRGEVK